eukprot:TRINITY_DN1637_c0_g1_i4.p1 TRINITY_DN1637_c0_g1~~TRINITY_DN1637_c0_g1_i4.p1  ORF type:complete len:168 (+),score=32.87 TRINITY_DN1637_c0_g1_i4:628-1131(+)
MGTEYPHPIDSWLVHQDSTLRAQAFQQLARVQRARADAMEPGTDSDDSASSSSSSNSSSSRSSSSSGSGGGDDDTGLANYRGSALYCLPSLFNHSCQPNVSVDFYFNNIAVARALHDIPAGTPLSIEYIDSDSYDVHGRRMKLRKYGFVCQCQRCVQELCSDDKNDT